MFLFLKGQQPAVVNYWVTIGLQPSFTEDIVQATKDAVLFGRANEVLQIIVPLARKVSLTQTQKDK